MNIIMEEKEKMKNVKLGMVSVSKKIKQKSRLDKALLEIRQIVNNKVGDVSTLENDVNFIEYLCNLVENIEQKIKIKGEDKENIVIKLMCEYFPSLNNDRDIKRIRKTIEHICEKGLEKVSNSKVFLRYSFLGFLKKMLFT